MPVDARELENIGPNKCTANDRRNIYDPIELYSEPTSIDNRDRMKTAKNDDGEF